MPRNLESLSDIERCRRTMRLDIFWNSCFE